MVLVESFRLLRHMSSRNYSEVALWSNELSDKCMHPYSYSYKWNCFDFSVDFNESNGKIEQFERPSYIRLALQLGSFSLTQFISLFDPFPFFRSVVFLCTFYACWVGMVLFMTRRMFPSMLSSISEYHLRTKIHRFPFFKCEIDSTFLTRVQHATYSK